MYSKLATIYQLSPNRSARRSKVIDYIVIHCFVGQVTAARGLQVFANSDAQASAHYVVGYNGSIGCSVDEEYRAWTTGGSYKGKPIRVNGISGADIDHRAITIEVASDTTAPYAITDAAYKALIELLVDICKRHNIKELKWKCDKSLVGKPEQQNLAVHRWFANKSCPGDYIYARLGNIAKEVNEAMAEKYEGAEWSKEAREWAVSNGLIAGYGDGDYGWGDGVTREQLAVILYRMSQL